ncbi:hypothetical protein TCAL_16008 [Tigriopus californicus]|uniref:RING-type domain-containing protein n=1 Tax=Tigriopus californicus TaxID=6832 RepID=A0A553PP39_TIGCA|nr:hypothetical protein TCAL_16008 [Tigriopus californicus]
MPVPDEGTATGAWFQDPKKTIIGKQTDRGPSNINNELTAFVDPGEYSVFHLRSRNASNGAGAKCQRLLSVFFLQDRLVHSMSRDDIEKADNPEEECVVCCQARSVMQVAPCGHQCQCRLCFVQNIQDAVANRDLPLRCLICNAKILRVKNNSKYGSGQDHPVHNALTGAPKFPKSVSGYSLQQNNGMPHSASNYSMSSAQEGKVSSPSGKENEAITPESDRSLTNQQSPKSIDSRIRAIQGYVRVPMDGGDDEDENVAPFATSTEQESSTQAPSGVANGKSRLQMTRDNFRRSNSEGSQPQASHPKPGLLRRLSANDKHHSRRFSKSPELAETTFTMTTIEEENEISISLKNLAQTSKDDDKSGSTN